MNLKKTRFYFHKKKCMVFITVFNDGGRMFAYGFACMRACARARVMCAACLAAGCAWYLMYL